MADLKISALTSGDVPLAGTEVLPIVQSSTTKKVSVADLTAGRSVSGLSFASTVATGTAPLTVASTTNVANLNASSLSGGTFAAPGAIGSATPSTGVFTLGTINSAGYMLKFFAADGITAKGYLYTDGTDMQLDTQAIGTPFTILNGGYATVKVGYSNTTLYHSNLIFAEAAKGVNFTANTPAAGMTSQLLNWYEEGTWTPNQGSGLTVVGAFSSSGTYVRIGRLVTVRGQVQGATSVSATAAGVISSNLPFVSAADTAGSAFNGTLTVSNAIDAAGSAIYSAGAFSPTVAIYFSVSYMV